MSLATCLYAQTLSGGWALGGGTTILPAPCNSGTLAEMAGTSCTLNGGVLISYPDVDSLYDPPVDCVITGTGPVCPTQTNLNITPDCSVGTQLASCAPATTGGVNPTRLFKPAAGGFSFSCSAACSMTVSFHNYIQFGTTGGPRLNGAGGSGNFSIVGSQTVAGSTSTASCSSTSCGTTNFPTCLTVSPYCTVFSSTSMSFGTAVQAELSQLVFTCTSGACTFWLGSLGDHDSQ